MGTPTVSQKIDAYAKAHLTELKKKQGLKNFTKYDIAEIMLKSGALTQAEMNSWRSTGEGFSANNRSGSVFGSGYAGQESYLDEMTDFSQKSTFEKNLEIMNPKKLRYETPKQRKTRQAQYKQHVQDQQASARIKNTKAYQNQEAMKKYLATLPPCTESYEELIASQKFESLDKSGKIKFLMEATGRKFYEAMEKGDKSAMRKYAIEGMSYVFAYMDDKSGITDIKDAVKKYSGLNALVDVVDKIVDDGDADNLSGAEKTWATIKGAGDAVDSFIGTQGVAVMGSLFLAGEAAAAAGMAKLFAVATQAYFGIEGATLVYEGGKEIAEATTEEQARTGGTKLTSGAIMLAGTVKSVKQGYENYKASQAHKADIANARKTLGLEGDAPLTEASIKAAKKSLALANHPDRGGSVEAMQNINDAASLLLKELKGGTLATTTASTAEPKASADENMPTVSTKTTNAPVVQSSPSTYRAKLPTPDYSKTRANFPTDAHQSLSKAGKATAYTTDGQPDGIVYQGKDGKMYVPNKWDPEHPYEVSTGADGKPASVIMVYDEAGGDFAVGDPTTIASTYKNPATGELDPLYSAKPGKSNAIDIVKDQVPSAYKIVKPGTEIQTKEGPRVVQPDEIVVYDTDGDPYVMPKKNFLKRQEPLKGDAESEALYARLKNGEPVPESQIAISGNATKPSAKTYQQTSTVSTKKTYVKPEVSTTELASKEDIASSAFEKPIWKNTVISKQARADVKFVKEQYGLDIDVLRDNKVKIGNEVFDCGNLDKGEIATAVKVAYEGVEPTWGTKFNTQQFSLAEKIYAKKFQSDYKNRVIKEMPIQIRNEAAEWFDNNFNPKTSLAGNFAERRDFYCYPNDYTKSKAIKFADYSAANAIIEPWVAVRLELLAKKGYEIVVHGRETRDDSVTSDIEVISPSGKVTIVHHTERGVRDMDAILQELTNSQ